jgi:hypothetical protein
VFAGQHYDKKFLIALGGPRSGGKNAEFNFGGAGGNVDFWVPIRQLIQDRVNPT